MSHFLENSQVDPDLSFFDFIAMHYAGDDGTTADDETDNNLPCHNVTHSSITVDYSPMVREFPPVNLPSPVISRYSIPVSAGMVSGHISRILQPPKQA